jgi:hypothetical protein
MFVRVRGLVYEAVSSIGFLAAATGALGSLPAIAIGSQPGVRPVVDLRPFLWDVSSRTVVWPGERRDGVV